MENAITASTMALDSTVRSQESSGSNDSKESSNVGSKADSCHESKHSKEILLSEKQQKQQQHQAQPRQQRGQGQEDRGQKSSHAKDDSNALMFTSCGQLLLGVILVVFGVLVLVHGASLGSSGAGLWAGAGALVAGALGVVATLATSSGKANSAFSTAHLASSLVSLALSNMAAITALTAVVRDAQRSSEITLLALSNEENDGVVESQGGWAGLLASIGLLIVSIAELLLSGYTCLTLTPKLCGCLRSPNQVEESNGDGRLKTRNMVHQWVIAQNHVPKNQPIYVVQPVVPVHPMMQPPYGIPPPGTGKYPPGFIAPGGMPIPTAAYAPVPVLPPGAYIQRPPSGGMQMIRSKHKRHQTPEHIETATIERKKHQQQEGRNGSTGRKMSSIGEDQVDLAQTYTGLDKKMSEEFISIAMDPDRKSKASSHHGSEIGTTKATTQ